MNIWDGYADSPMRKGALYRRKDNGDVCGTPGTKKLMEDIPNKVRDMLGILVDVNLKEKMKSNILKL